MIYGYINEYGQLTSRDFSATEAEDIDCKWLPVDSIDATELDIEEDGKCIQIEPFAENGRIKFRYNKVFDVFKATQDLKEAREKLAESDYKILKCCEQLLKHADPSIEMPYDIGNLVIDRENDRGKVNELEEQINQDYMQVAPLNP